MWTDVFSYERLIYCDYLKLYWIKNYLFITWRQFKPDNWTGYTFNISGIQADDFTYHFRVKEKNFPNTFIKISKVSSIIVIAHLKVFLLLQVYKVP